MRTLLAMLGIFALAGCTIQMDQFLTTDYQIGAPKTVTVGSPMLTITSGTRWPHGDVVDQLTQMVFYGGITGSTLKLSYQEFSYQISRPTFTQDLQYDLAKSRTIKFRDITMQIDSADNSTITYRVTDGPLPVTPTHWNAGSFGITVENKKVVELLMKSAAIDAGFELGDVILSVDNVALTGDTTHDQNLVNVAPGARHEFKVQRGKSEITLVAD